MAILIEMLEVGGDIVTTISGSANTTSLTPTNISQISAIVPNPVWVTSINGASTVRYYSIGVPVITNIGTGTNFVTQTTTPNGDGAGFRIIGPAPYTAYLVLPQGYTTGTPISSDVTSGGFTFASAGLRPGTYTWEWGTGEDADSITIQVGPAEPTPTPTPTSTSTPTPTASTTPTPTSTSTPTPTPSSSPVTTTTTTEPMIVKSANTEYVECRICDDVAQTQNTPHPVYTDNKGNEVIQMNAVVIGGNGLNA
jgi:cell division septation protein DedD